jgi:hypothetical protein
MLLFRVSRAVTVLALALCLSPLASAEQGQQNERSLKELQNTVVNLLQALVDRGVLTREQAESMIKSAQDKAAADVAAAAAEQQKAEEGAVRVPYVPQVVKEEIRKEVAADLAPTVQQDVKVQLGSADTLRSVLPEWVERMRWTADVRARGEGDDFGKNNATNTYLDFNAVNAKGGISKAGIAGLLNTTDDRDRLRVRLRFGFDSDLGSGWSAGMRIATGSGETYVTTNQTLGTYGQRYLIALDQGYVRWTGATSTGRQIFSTALGRFANPWMSTDLVWYNDLTFEGWTSSYRLNLSSDNTERRDLFATIGAFPLQDVTPSSKDKWLAAAQLGTDLHFEGATRLRFGAAYYDYIHIAGERNAPESALLNYTAPSLVQKGNTMFDIWNAPLTNPGGNLFALAADYRIADLLAIGELQVLPHYSVGLTAEALKNVGFDSARVMARTGGTYVAPRTKGYRGDLSFGSGAFGPFGSWRIAAGYRYLQRDAVLDAFNDNDFHLGGTDARGYTVTLDYAFNPRVWLRAKYLAAREIDGPPLVTDVWQFDVNTQF